VYAEDAAAAKSCIDAAFKRMSGLEQVLSPDRPGSDSAKLEAAAGGSPLRIGPDLMLVLRKAQGLSRRTDAANSGGRGAFDVTAGPLQSLWQRARQSGQTPSDEQINQALALVGWRNLELDSDKQTARLKLAGMRLDLGDIGRGYLADQTLQILKQYSNGRALVQIGSSISVGEAPRMSAGWQVRLENADPEARKQSRMLYNAGVASAGGAEQSVTASPSSQPMIDPRTGKPVDEPAAVTVVAPNALTAAPLAAAASILGPARAKSLLRDYAGTTAYFRNPEPATTLPAATAR
jgi:thiamine biosynthesis lipoprotein